MSDHWISLLVGLNFPTRAVFASHFPDGARPTGFRTLAGLENGR